MKRTKIPKKLIQLKQGKEFKMFRIRQWQKQDKICPVLKKQIKLKEAVMDHKHKLKKEIAGKDGKGLCRGIVHNGVNVIEGKIQNAFLRYGLRDLITVPELLRNLADYIDNPPIKQIYIHPSEKIKNKKKVLGILAQKRILKYWGVLYPRRKLPKLPKKTGKKQIRFITKKWQGYIDTTNKYHEQITGKQLKR